MPFKLHEEEQIDDHHYVSKEPKVLKKTNHWSITSIVGLIRRFYNLCFKHK